MTCKMAMTKASPAAPEATTPTHFSPRNFPARRLMSSPATGKKMMRGIKLDIGSC